MAGRDGSQGRARAAVFPTNPVDTVSRDEPGKAAWLGEKPIDARGFGCVADLAVAASNDFAPARGGSRRQAAANDNSVLMMEAA